MTRAVLDICGLPDAPARHKPGGAFQLTNPQRADHASIGT